MFMCSDKKNNLCVYIFSCLGLLNTLHLFGEGTCERSSYSCTYFAAHVHWEKSHFPLPPPVKCESRLFNRLVNNILCLF